MLAVVTHRMFPASHSSITSHAISRHHCTKCSSPLPPRSNRHRLKQKYKSPPRTEGSEEKQTRPDNHDTLVRVVVYLLRWVLPNRLLPFFGGNDLQRDRPELIQMRAKPGRDHPVGFQLRVLDKGGSENLHFFEDF